MEYHFGEKLRAVRERKGRTMKDVAEKAGVSESLISQIERNRISPAIDTLLRIADVLDIDFEYLFSDYRKTRKVSIVKRADRSLHTIQGITYEQLARMPGDQSSGIEAYYMSVPAGCASGSDEYGHPGRELGVIVDGQATFSIGGEEYALESGDTIAFESDVPHRLTNTGTSALRALWIITPPKLFKDL